MWPVGEAKCLKTLRHNHAQCTEAQRTRTLPWKSRQSLTTARWEMALSLNISDKARWRLFNFSRGIPQLIEAISSSTKHLCEALSATGLPVKSMATFNKSDGQSKTWMYKQDKYSQTLLAARYNWHLVREEEGCHRLWGHTPLRCSIRAPPRLSPSRKIQSYTSNWLLHFKTVVTLDSFWMDTLHSTQESNWAWTVGLHGMIRQVQMTPALQYFKIYKQKW